MAKRYLSRVIVARNCKKKIAVLDFIPIKIRLYVNTHGVMSV